MDRYTALTLIVSLVLYPLLYSLDFFSTVFPSSVKGIWEFGTLVKSTDKAGGFVAIKLIYHWVPFLFVWFALLKTMKITSPLV